MLADICNAVIASVRRRVGQGDCPTEPAHTVETLESVIIDLAPKVASDTGAGLRDKIARSAWDDMHPSGTSWEDWARHVDANGGFDGRAQAYRIADAIIAALATDATGSSDASIVPSNPVDGATGGGYPKGATIAVDACGPVDATTPGGDLLEQADIVDVVLPIIVQNTPSVGLSAHHVACDVADAVLRALSARNQTDEGGEK